MFKLSRCATLGHVVRNFGITRKIFASTSVLAEKHEPTEVKKLDSLKKPKNPTIAAVFASLNDIDETSTDLTKGKGNRVSLDEVIMNAKTVNGLLTIAETQPDISRNHALKIVSILAEWSTIHKIKLNDFETDARFMRLCRILGRTINLKNANNNVNNRSKSGFRSDDMSLVFGVTGDDEAAKLVATLTLQQMVKVIKNLAMKKRRSTPLLRSLSYNISGKEQVMDIKQCSDVLYSMASLNFPDPVLIAKISENIQESLKEPLEKSSVVGSILTSLAFLKYREPLLLDTLIEYIVKNHEVCRVQDIAALFTSLAILNYTPLEHEAALKNTLVASLTPADFKSSQEYLNFVWSLMALNFPLQSFYDSVLKQDFINELITHSSDKDIPTVIKMKLLNINAGVKLFFPTYNGAMLSRDRNKDIYEIPLVHNREKLLIVDALNDAIKSLVPENCLKLNHDTNMGFVVDAEFFVDEKGTPVATESKNGKRIALMIHDFRDMCQGPQQHLNGITELKHRLLLKAGYHVISVPYNEFSISDKLLKRVQYLEKLIKSINKN